METVNTSFKSRFYQLMKNKKFRTFLNSLYSVGASVVVLGALFKIQHWTGAGEMLTIGLLTEALIFFVYAFEPSEEEEHFETSGQIILKETDENNHGFIALAKFDKMLGDAEISPDLFYSLGEGMKKLSESTENMTTMVDVSAASVNYLNTIKMADESLAKTAKTYENVISDVVVKTIFKYKGISHSLENIDAGSREFKQQMHQVSKNLHSLNEIYDAQRKVANEYLKDQIHCAAETQKNKELLMALNQNLSALNQHYSNVVSAINFKK